MGYGNLLLKLRMAAVGTVLVLAYLFLVAPLVGIATEYLAKNVGIGPGTAALLSNVSVIAFMPVTVALFYVSSKKRLLSSYDLRELGKNARIRQASTELSQDMGITEPDLYVTDDQEVNALAVGRPKDGAVIFHEDLLRRLNYNELENVLAHEFSHIKNRDSYLMLSSYITGLAVGYVWRYIAYIGFSLRIAVKRMAVGLAAGRFGFVVVHDTVSQKHRAKMAARRHGRYARRLIQLFSRSLSRNREYYADETAVKATGKPGSMVTALKKIRAFNPGGVNTDGITQSLCIHGPHSGTVGRLYSTHPRMEKRISRIERKFF
ncbi:MAG: M48 family metallopeptidase [Halobacteria archaeon]